MRRSARRKAAVCPGSSTGGTCERDGYRWKRTVLLVGGIALAVTLVVTLDILGRAFADRCNRAVPQSRRRPDRPARQRQGTFPRQWESCCRIPRSRSRLTSCAARPRSRAFPGPKVSCSFGISALAASYSISGIHCTQRRRRWPRTSARVADQGPTASARQQRDPGGTPLRRLLSARPWQNGRISAASHSRW